MAQRLALVLSGGGNLGICQVPFLQRLMDLDINPDMIVGTSVGALNGAFLAFHPHNIDGLADVWRALRDQRMWDRNLLRIGRNLLLGRMSLYSNEFLRELIEPYVTVDELAAAEIPLYITATSLDRGVKQVFSNGSVIDAVLASCAIPGVFPRSASAASGTSTREWSPGSTSRPPWRKARRRSSRLTSAHRPRHGDRAASSMCWLARWRSPLNSAPVTSWSTSRPACRQWSGVPACAPTAPARLPMWEELYHAAEGMAPALIDAARRVDGSWIPGIYQGAVPLRYA